MGEDIGDGIGRCGFDLMHTGDMMCRKLLLVGAEVVDVVLEEAINFTEYVVLN